jgi:hypothetical protein
VRSNDPRVLAVATALASLFEALRSDRSGETPDELVPFPFGFERRAARALVRGGGLATTKIGRRIYARRSALIALVGDAAKPVRDMPTAANDPAAAAREAYASPLRAVGGRSR